MTATEIADVHDLEETIRREYHDLETSFDTSRLYKIVSEIKSQEVSKAVRKALDGILDLHLDRQGIAVTAEGLRERQEPPCYSAFVVEVLEDELVDEVDKPSPMSLGDRVLYCFDRDATVETGVPRGPVPLDTVLRLAEEHVVYATGNQHLKAEAAIPGVVDVHPGQVSRSRGISLVWQKEREHVDATVAVDDVDVSDVADVDVYYEPWEFYLLQNRHRDAHQNSC